MQFRDIENGQSGVAALIVAIDGIDIGAPLDQELDLSFGRRSEAAAYISAVRPSGS